MTWALLQAISIARVNMLAAVQALDVERDRALLGASNVAELEAANERVRKATDEVRHLIERAA